MKQLLGLTVFLLLLGIFFWWFEQALVGALTVCLGLFNFVVQYIKLRGQGQRDNWWHQ
jgi:uncharacterized membrane protein